MSDKLNHTFTDKLNPSGSGMNSNKARASSSQNMGSLNTDEHKDLISLDDYMNLSFSDEQFSSMT